MRSRQLTLVALLLLLHIASASAAPQIDYLKAQFVYPAQIQISWKISSDDGLARLELFKDDNLIHKEKLTGTAQTSLYQIGEDNKTHEFELIVYDIFNLSTSLTKVRGSDRTPPNITSIRKILSNKKQLAFATTEPAVCLAGFEINNLVEVEEQYSVNHTITLPFVEGSNSVFVTCSDREDNQMLKPATIEYVLDMIAPTKISDPNYEIGKDVVKLRWTPAVDNNGIDHYNIYSTLQLIATSKEPSWNAVTNDSVYYISAVDKAGNEGDKTEFNAKRAVLLSSDFTVEQTEEEVLEIAPENKTITEKESPSTTSIIAWAVFGLLMVIFTGWKIYERQTDKHGLRKYLKLRRKMRDFDIKHKL
jgi:hypothetical protein